jgi:hypothetical protein
LVNEISLHGQNNIKTYIRLLCVFANVVVGFSLNEMYAAIVALCRSSLTNPHVSHPGIDDHSMLKRVT